MESVFIKFLPEILKTANWIHYDILVLMKVIYNYEWFWPFIRRQISPTVLQLYLKQKPIKCYGNPKEVCLQHSLERASSRGASKNAPSKIQKKYWGNFCNAALQINIPLPVIMNRKIKKPPVKLKFWWSQ